MEAADCDAACRSGHRNRKAEKRATRDDSEERRAETGEGRERHGRERRANGRGDEQSGKVGVCTVAVDDLLACTVLVSHLEGAITDRAGRSCSSSS